MSLIRGGCLHVTCSQILWLAEYVLVHVIRKHPPLSQSTTAQQAHHSQYAASAAERRSLITTLKRTCRPPIDVRQSCDLVEDAGLQHCRRRTVATGGALSVGAVCCWAAQCGARRPVYTSSDVTPLPLVSVSGLNITTSRARTPTLLFVLAHLWQWP